MRTPIEHEISKLTKGSLTAQLHLNPEQSLYETMAGSPQL